MRDLSVWARRLAAAVSLKPPLPPLVRGVRRAQVATMSEGALERIDSLPRGISTSEEERWDAT